MAKLAERVVRDITEYFQANIETKLQSLNQEYNDEITLEVPAKWAYSEEDLDQLDKWPCILIMVPHVDIVGYNNQSTENTYNVVFGVLLMEQDTTKLKFKHYRYARAIFELIVEGGRVGGMSWFPVSNFAMDFQPFYQHNDTFVSDSQVSVVMSSRQLERI